MLQVDPLGLASRWKPGGAFAGSGGGRDGGTGGSHHSMLNSTEKKAKMPMTISTTVIA